MRSPWCGRYHRAAVATSPLSLLGGEGAGSKKPGSSLGHIAFRFDLVTRYLQSHETVIRHVLVEGLNHKIAEVVCVSPILVEGISVTLSKACQIKPMPGPALAIMGPVEESIDEFFICLGRLVAEVGLIEAASTGQTWRAEKRKPMPQDWA